MSRGIDDLEGPTAVAELDPGGVDGDVLGLLLQQRIQEEGVFKRHPLLPARLFHRRQFALRKRVGVGKETPNQGGLAVVDVTHHHDPRPRFARRPGGGSAHPLRKKGRLETGRNRLRGWRHGHPAHRNPFARSFCMAFRSW